MNAIVNKYYQPEMKCIEMHSRQSGFTYSASGPSTRDKEQSNLIKKTADSRHIYQN